MQEICLPRLAHIYLERADMAGEAASSFLNLASRACADAVAAAGKVRLMRTWGQALLFRGRAMLRLGNHKEAFRSAADSANRCQARQSFVFFSVFGGNRGRNHGTSMGFDGKS